MARYEIRINGHVVSDKDGEILDVKTAQELSLAEGVSVRKVGEINE